MMRDGMATPSFLFSKPRPRMIKPKKRLTKRRAWTVLRAEYTGSANDHFRRSILSVHECRSSAEVYTSATYPRRVSRPSTIIIQKGRRVSEISARTQPESVAEAIGLRRSILQRVLFFAMANSSWYLYALMESRLRRDSNAAERQRTEILHVSRGNQSQVC